MLPDCLVSLGIENLSGLRWSYLFCPWTLVQFNIYCILWEGIPQFNLALHEKTVSCSSFPWWSLFCRLLTVSFQIMARELSSILPSLKLKLFSAFDQPGQISLCLLKLYHTFLGGQKLQLGFTAYRYDVPSLCLFLFHHFIWYLWSLLTTEMIFSQINK